MDPCKDEEPQVIDFTMLTKCIQAQFPQGEAGRLTREEGIPYHELKEITMDFLRILRIDHLWVLSALTKLIMNNNLIEKIENLESLVHLKELNLSFNKITKIENLDALVNLEILSLYENRISVIENMNNLKKLIIFSIGNNLIEDRRNILSLRWFPDLTSVNMAGNPCAKEDDFRIYVGTFLTQILYYEYKMVSAEERMKGQELYSHELILLQESELQVIETEAEEKRLQTELELNSESFVEFLSDRYLFDRLFEEDAEGSTILLLGEEAKDFYTEFEEQFVALCKDIFELGQQQHKLRKAEIDEFTNSVEKAKSENQRESIEHMEEFMQEKNKDVYRKVKKLHEYVDTGAMNAEQFYENIVIYNQAFEELIHNTWKKLMGLEMTLYGQIEDCNQTFEHTMTEMINIFIESAQGLFAQIRALEVTYTENIAEFSGRLITMATLQGETIWPPEAEWIMLDKEVLNNAIGATHDLHMQRIDTREDTLMNRAKSWLDNFVQTIQREEIARNRLKVLEINYFLDMQKEEYKIMQTPPAGPVMDPDISAALG